MNDWRSLLEDGYLSSLWLLDREPGPLDFHGAFIPAVAEGLIRRWCLEDGWIWDPMCGSGTAGYVAAQWGRNSFLTDLNPIAPSIGQGDARHIAVYESSSNPAVATIQGPHHGRRFKFDAIVLHPPYHNIIQFSDNPDDLSNCGSVTEFLMEWRQVVHNTAAHLRDKGYLVIVAGDIWITREIAKQTGEPYGHYPLAHDCLQEALEVMSIEQMAPVLKAIVTKDIKGNRQDKNRHLRAARAAKWGAVLFETETIAAIQKNG